MTNTTPIKPKRKRKLTVLELSNPSRLAARRLELFTGWTKTRVIETALLRLEKNRHLLLADAIKEGGAS